MTNKIKKILEPMLGYGLVMLMVLAIISIFAILGAPILQLVGFKYESVGSIILFFIIVAIVGFPVETFAKALPKVFLYDEMISIKSSKILYVMLDTLSTIITMTIVDYFMDSVSGTDISIVIIAFILALISVNDIDDEVSFKG